MDTKSIVCCRRQSWGDFSPLSKNRTRGEQSMRKSIALIATVVACFVSMSCGSAIGGDPRTQHSPEAGQILEATGVTGGLIVHLGCGDGKLTAALATSDGYLVHGLDTDAENVTAARQQIHSLDLYGRVSADHFDGRRLPYADNLVNLVVSSDEWKVAREEVLRVLVPGGIAVTLDARLSTLDSFRKPVSPELDEWTHFMHDATGNPVSKDTVVGPPRRLQWIGEPKWDRSHEELASLSAMVSGGGRIFYIMDEGSRASIRLPAKWMLVARDAFNGVVLWKRPIEKWQPHLHAFRSGPPNLALRLVAAGDRVYVTLGIDSAVSALDAATGKTLLTYPGTEGATQILHSDGTLIVLVGDTKIVAVQSDSGKLVWQQDIDPVAYPTVAVCGGKVVYQSPEGVSCLELASGKLLWRAACSMNFGRSNKLPSWGTPALVATEDFAYSADFATLRAFSVADGQQLWSAPTNVYFHARPFVAVIDGIVWTNLTGNTHLSVTGHDCRTGAIRKTIEPPQDMYPSLGHARCYLPKATTRYILSARCGTEFVDVKTGEMRLNHWVRGTCQYGVMPSGGLLYAPPHSCACEMRMKLEGFFALAGESRVEGGELRAEGGELRVDERLERGPAYSQIANGQSAIENSLDWPTYRANPARSGAIETSVSDQLDVAWQADVGGKLSAITIAAGKAFVASVEAHTVHALDAHSGRRMWSYTAGGRVDSPPTICRFVVTPSGGSSEADSDAKSNRKPPKGGTTNSLCLFGSADGWVYCLRADDGELVWRYRVAPEERQVVVHGQLESAWPVHGSVLVLGDEAIVAAGRSSYLDGGIRVCRLQPAHGKMISETVFYSPDPKSHVQPTTAGRPERLPGVKSDILSSDGESVYMRHLKLDFEGGSQTQLGLHLYSPTGFLDDTWWHRSYWLFARQFLLGLGQPSCPGNGWNDWWNLGNVVPSGRIMVYDGDCFYGYGRNMYPGFMGGQWRGGEAYHLFASPRNAADIDPQRLRELVTQMRTRKGRHTDIQYRWTAGVPMTVRAMALAGQTLFIAGPPDIAKPERPGSLTLTNTHQVVAASEGKLGAVLWAMSAADGKQLSEMKLEAMPVWDGMAAAQGRLFLSTLDGKVLCLGGQNKTNRQRVYERR
jgi:outer membrane protein assembly factor BamB/SAM-dependent methyltransferase